MTTDVSKTIIQCQWETMRPTIFETVYHAHTQMLPPPMTAADILADIDERAKTSFWLKFVSHLQKLGVV